MIKKIFYISLTLLFGLNISAAEPDIPRDIVQRTGSKRELTRKKIQNALNTYRKREEERAEKQRFQDKLQHEALLRYKGEQVRIASEADAALKKRKEEEARARLIDLERNFPRVSAPPIPRRLVRAAPPLPPKPAETRIAPTPIFPPSVRPESENLNIKDLLRRFHSRTLTNLNQEIAQEHDALNAGKLTKENQEKLFNNHLNAANGTTRYYLKDEDPMAAQIETIQEAHAHLSAMNLFARSVPADTEVKKRVYFITTNIERFIQNTLTKQSDEKANQIMREVTAIKGSLRSNNLFPSDSEA